MTIPRCNEAAGNKFGREFRWLMDAISGYNQICVVKVFSTQFGFFWSKLIQIYIHFYAVWNRECTCYIHLFHSRYRLHLERTRLPLRYFNWQQH